MMVRHLQKIGNSRGIILDRAILDLLQIEEDGAFEITHENGGLFLKPLSANQAYQTVSRKHRKSLDKLGQ